MATGTERVDREIESERAREEEETVGKRSGWRRTGRALWCSSTMVQREDKPRWRWQPW